MGERSIDGRVISLTHEPWFLVAVDWLMTHHPCWDAS